MAKLFYTIQEAAQRLGMSEDAVKGLVTSGRLQEFRDRDRLMFKVEQVDLLAGGGGEEDAIPLADSGEIDIALSSDSGAGIPAESPKERSGLSIFETEGTDESDPAALTHVSGTSPTEIPMDSAGSGSGLLDLTREADDTSLGDLLTDGGATRAETAVGVESGGALFESSGADAEGPGTGAGPALVAIGEPYDGAGSGFAGGLSLGMVAVMALATSVVIFAMNGSHALIDSIGGNYWAFVGGAGGLVLVVALIGWFLGRMSD